MSQRKKLFGNAAVYTLTNALSSGIPFLMMPVLTRILTPEDYGIVAMFGVLLSVVGAFTGLSVHGAVGIRYFEQDRFYLPSYIASCMMILVTSTSAIFFVVCFCTPQLTKLTQVSGTWLLTGVLVSGSQFVIQIQLTLWQSSCQPWKYGALRIAQSAIDAVVSLVCVVGLGLAWQGRLGGITVAAFFFALFSFITLRRENWLKWPVNKRYAKDALHFGVPLIPHVIGGLLIAMVDRILISNVLDVASTGIYMVALQIGMVLGLLTESFNRAFAPWLIESLKQEDEARDRIIVRYTYLYFVIISLIAIASGLMAPAILGLLVGEQFRAASGVVVYITSGFAFGGMYYMVTNYVFIAGRTPSLAMITFGCGIFNFVITYVLLQNNGLVGAAQGFMLSQAALFFGTWWLAQRSRPMPWRRAVLIS